MCRKRSRRAFARGRSGRVVLIAFDGGAAIDS
jgi:hypothetical protein